jgi:hypothetical protein
MKIAIERVFRVLPPMRVHIVVYFIPENVILLYYGTRTTVQWNGITAVYRKTLLTTGYSLQLAAIARLFYEPERPDPPIQVTGKIGTGIPYRIPNDFNTGNPGLRLYFSNPWFEPCIGTVSDRRLPVMVCEEQFFLRPTGISYRYSLLR